MRLIWIAPSTVFVLVAACSSGIAYRIPTTPPPGTAAKQVDADVDECEKAAPPGIDHRDWTYASCTIARGYTAYVPVPRWSPPGTGKGHVPYNVTAMGPHEYRIRRCTDTLLIVVVVGLGALAEEQPSIDPQSLVGEWVGSWTQARAIGAAPAGGSYRMTIRRVARSKVFGHLEISKRRILELDFVGTLEGNRLTYGRTELTIHVVDNLMEMRGSSQGGTPAALGNTLPIDIVLSKEK